MSHFQVIARANNVEFGLTASVFTSDVSRAHRVSKQIEVSLTLFSAGIDLIRQNLTSTDVRF